jgi:hypothetical protein
MTYPLGRPYSCPIYSISPSLLTSLLSTVQLFVLSLSCTISIQVFLLSLCSLSLSPVRHPSRCSYYLCVHCLSSLSLVFMISLLSLCLSCLYRLSAFVFLDIHIYIHSFTLVALFRGGFGASQLC